MSIIDAMLIRFELEFIMVFWFGAENALRFDGLPLVVLLLLPFNGFAAMFGVSARDNG